MWVTAPSRARAVQGGELGPQRGRGGPAARHGRVLGPRQPRHRAGHAGRGRAAGRVHVRRRAERAAAAAAPQRPAALPRREPQGARQRVSPPSTSPAPVTAVSERARGIRVCRPCAESPGPALWASWAAASCGCRAVVERKTCTSRRAAVHICCWGRRWIRAQSAQALPAREHLGAECFRRQTRRAEARRGAHPRLHPGAQAARAAGRRRQHGLPPAQGRPDRRARLHPGDHPALLHAVRQLAPRALPCPDPATL